MASRKLRQKGFAVQPKEITPKGYYRQNKFNKIFKDMNNLTTNIQLAKCVEDGDYILIPGWRLCKFVEYWDAGIYMPFHMKLRGSDPIPVIIVPGAVEIR